MQWKTWMWKSVPTTVLALSKLAKIKIKYFISMQRFLLHIVTIGSEIFSIFQFEKI